MGREPCLTLRHRLLPCRIVLLPEINRQWGKTYYKTLPKTLQEGEIRRQV